MLGVIVNCIAVLLGGSIGLLLKKGIPQKISSAALSAIGLCVAYIGIDGMLDGENIIVLIFSSVFGVIIGTLLDIDDKLNKFGGFLNQRLSKNKSDISADWRLSIQTIHVMMFLVYKIKSRIIN